jgi:hypothetical protein
MEDWLGCVWEHQPGALSKPQSMLAMHAFRGHLSKRIRNRLWNKNTDLVIIPSGMTCQLQALDVSINKPFKHPVRKHCDAWLNKDKWQNKMSISINNSGVDIKSLYRSASQYYSTIVFKVLFV